MRAVVVFVALVACGDNIPTVELADYADALIDARCERLSRCGVFADDEECSDYFRRIPNSDLVSAVEAGKVRYDGNAATRCIAAVAAASCNTTTEDSRAPEGCDRVFRGTLAKGAECAFDSECASGACNAPSCTMECCRGTCVDAELAVDATVPVGGACRSDIECVYGSACIGAGVDPGACRALPLLGEACPYNRCAEIGARCAANQCVSSGLDAPCSSDAECSEFNLCDLTTQRCAPVPTLGMPCTTFCAGAAWCDRDAAPPTCAPPLETGAPCRTSDQCDTLLCREGESFDVCTVPEACF